MKTTPEQKYQREFQVCKILKTYVGQDRTDAAVVANYQPVELDARQLRLTILTEENLVTPKAHQRRQEVAGTRYVERVETQ